MKHSEFSPQNYSNTSGYLYKSRFWSTLIKNDLILRSLSYF